MSEPKFSLSFIKFSHPNKKLINHLYIDRFLMILFDICFFEMISYIFYDKEYIETNT